MKNLSFLLNIVLAIAVAVLYYLHFSGRPAASVEKTTGADSASATKIVAELPKDIKGSKIVYVNVDSLYNHYELYLELKKEIEGKRTGLEASYKSQGESLQKDYFEFQQKYAAGMVSQDEAKKADEEFKRRKDNLDGVQRRLAELAEKADEQTERVEKNITEYLREYNKNANYNYVLAYTTSTVGSVLMTNPDLDITNEIVDGLNALHRKSKTESPAKK